jgi:hypothetical protein
MCARDLLVVLMRAMGLLLGLLLLGSIPLELGVLIIRSGFRPGGLFSSAGIADSGFAIWIASNVLLTLTGAGLLSLFAGRIGHWLARRSSDRPGESQRFTGTRIDVLAAMIRLLAVYGLFRTVQPLEKVIKYITAGMQSSTMAGAVGAALKIVFLAGLSFFFLFRAGPIATWLETRPWDAPTIPDDEEDDREEAAGAAG